MENTINQRLKQVIDHLKYNKMIYNETDFCERVGFVKSFLSDMNENSVCFPDVGTKKNL